MQEYDRAYIQAPLAIGLSKSMFTFHTKEALNRITPINGTPQRYIRTTLRQRILHLCHHPLSPVHPAGERQMYDSMRQQLYWSHTADDVYNAMASCMSCTRNRLTNMKQRKLRQIPLAGFLGCVSIDIFGLLPNAESGSKYIVVITYRYSSLTKAVLTAETTAQVFLISSRVTKWPASGYLLKY